MELSCENCGVSHGPDDMFCENCGYDFITGSLPPDAEQPVSAADLDSALDVSAAPTPSSAAPSILDADESAPSPGTPPAGGEVPRLRVAIAVDRPFFDQMVNDGEIEFPDPVPTDRELALAGTELHIGRTSESRAIHPDIDVADLTGDQAVSSRHAVLRVAGDGTFSIVDVGSTNGTFIDAADSEAIAQGVPVEVKAGVPIFVGAWTRITILD